MGCFYFTRWHVEEGEEREGKGKGGKKKEKLGITNKDKCLHITELKIGLMT